MVLRIRREQHRGAADRQPGTDSSLTRWAHRCARRRADVSCEAEAFDRTFDRNGEPPWATRFCSVCDPPAMPVRRRATSSKACVLGNCNVVDWPKSGPWDSCPTSKVVLIVGEGCKRSLLSALLA